MPLVRRDNSEPQKEDSIENCGALLQKLRAESVAERLMAIRALSRFPQAIEDVGSLLSSEKSRQVREAIITALISIGTVEAARVLIPLLAGSDVELRNSAVEALQSMPEPTAAHMHTLLSDSDSDVRLFAISVMQGLNHPGILDWLVEVIKHETELNVCMAAVDLVAEIGTEQVMPDIEEVRARFPGEPFVDFVIDKALRALSADTKPS